MNDFIEIHTHDRIRFKRCRRKWYFQSPTRLHLQHIDAPPNIHLWFGTGFHFALEDFHGYNRFGDPVKALEAFYYAFKDDQLPEEGAETIALGMKMFEHYKQWMQRRDSYETVWMDGKPQVEVRFALELEDLSEKAGRPVVYRGTIDRLVQDVEGRYWIEDYKTAKRIDLSKLVNDPQISAYTWAAEQFYGLPIEGMLYTQFVKDSPSAPKHLVRGGLSVDQKQKTTYDVYRRELLDLYPSGNFPSKYINFLNDLAARETPEGDPFIRRDGVYRNTQAKEKTYEYIIGEVSEMINPDLPIYPNPTRDCSWECTEFRTVCTAMDEGDDWEYLLNNFYRRKEEYDETWRDRIKWPKQEALSR